MTARVRFHIGGPVLNVTDQFSPSSTLHCSSSIFHISSLLQFMPSLDNMVRVTQCTTFSYFAFRYFCVYFGLFDWIFPSLSIICTSKHKNEIVKDHSANKELLRVLGVLKMVYTTVIDIILIKKR